jgi:hypothetical protein
VDRARRRLQRGEVSLAAALLEIIASDLLRHPEPPICQRFVGRLLEILERNERLRKRP